MKRLNDIDVTFYFKKIGKKLTLFLLINVLVMAAIAWFGFSKVDNASMSFDSLGQKVEETEMSELRILKDKKELNNMELELAELKETFFERDKNIQLMKTLETVELLMVEHSFNNTAHEVLPLRRNSDLFEIPIQLEFVGEYEKVVQFLEDLNATELPIALRNLRMFVPEAEYEDAFKGTERIKASLDVLVYEEKEYVEKLKAEITEEKESPFGYFVYSVPEETTNGITDYQKYLEEFNRLNEVEEEAADVEGPTVP